VGALLTAAPGGWGNVPSGFAYQWEQGEGTTWVAVPGETGAVHRVTEDDTGLRLRLRVIASNADGSSAAYSVPTAVVGAEQAATTRGRVTLRVARGRGRGKRVRTVAFRLAGGRLHAARARVRLARGRYRLALCSTAAGARCARRTLTVPRRARTRLPALSLAVPAGTAGRVTYTARALHRLPGGR
jgi:hypothetical protein